MRTGTLAPAFLAIWATAFVVACSDAPTSPSGTETSQPPYTVTFESTLAPGGTSSRTFVVGGPGTVAVTLVSTTPSELWLSIGLGIPTATRTGCSLTAVATVPPGSTPHLQMAVEAGSYCVQVSDPGRLSSVAGFSVTIVHP